MRLRKIPMVPLAGSVVVYAASTMPAHAYLDPGTGSIILQVLLGGAAGLALAGKLYWHRFLTTIGVRAPEAHGAGAEEDAAARASSRTDS